MYIFDKKNVHVVNGLLGASQVTHGLGGVISMKVKQTLIAKKFDYGTITLNFFGGGTVDLEHIPNPKEYREAIQHILEELKK